MKLSKAYQAADFESDIYALWEKSGAFLPNQKGNQHFSIVVPPPNANGNLHIGHALTMAIQDVAIRYHRMKGDKTLFIPGADHAGFETQVVYEKQLAKDGKSRFDLSREELYRQIWEFVELNRGNFTSQFRRLGASVDWTRFNFTLDDHIIKQAYSTFKKMWDEGLIYRGERLVNFCTFHGTAFADIEVVHKEETSHLWYISYPLTDGSGELTVATTRPETMFGDTAVAVHPDDSRYKDFIGKTIKLPLTEREIPVIADDFVDPLFGTGAVKITPAHDPNDYEAGERHDLPKITVIDNEGKMNDNAPADLRGQDIKEARQATVQKLEEQGSLVKIEDITHNVGHCYKCDTVIQPLLRDQWFIDMKPLTKPAIEALQAGKIKFYPESKRDQLITYLENLKDWNISRQIVWGIPIPAFQNIDNPDDWIYDDNVTEMTITRDGKTYQRDSDVFDTWFSSSSWPYATLHFPNDQDFKDFYPLSLMETGGEILYPWVSRMIMLGLYITGDVPFRDVYIHGYVMAEDGAKMSKSLGNVINPLEVIDQYGADALRMGIMSGRTPAVNRGYDPRRVEEARNFCNKLWNIARYVEDKVGDYSQIDKPTAQSVADHWVLSKLQQSTDYIGRAINEYRFAEAYEAVYHLIWDDVADWYIEASKTDQNPALLAYVLETCLKLIHPFAPFVSETIWQALNWQPDSLLATSQWPNHWPAYDQPKATQFEQIKSIVSEIRAINSSLQLRKVELVHDDDPLIAEQGGLISRLARLGAITSGQSHGLGLSTTSSSAWLEIDPETLKKYQQDLQNRLSAAQNSVKQLEGRLGNEAYLYKAPAQLVEQSKAQLEEAKQLVEHLSIELKRYQV